MDLITGWVKNLIFVILFTTFLELFLPESNMRRYVRIIMGFFIITVLISPVAVLFNNDFTGLYNILPIEDNYNKNRWENIKNRGEEIKGEHQSYLDEYYHRELSTRIENIVSLDFPDVSKNISLELNDNYQIKSINVNLQNNDIREVEIDPVKIDEKSGQDNDSVETKINNSDVNQLKQRLSQIFQIPEKSINIKPGGER